MTRTAGGDATTRPRPAPPVDLRRHDRLQPDERDEAYRLYVELFEGVNELAAQRHLMTEDEFDTVCSDPRIDKIIAVDPTDGCMVGLSAATNDLPAWSMISPPYFARRWPDEYRYSRLWYVGFVGVHPAAPRQTFAALLAETSAPARAAGGVVCMDFCGFNVDSRRLPTVSGLVMRRIDRSTRTELVDRQEFWAFHFDGEQGA